MSCSMDKMVKVCLGRECCSSATQCQQGGQRCFQGPAVSNAQPCLFVTPSQPVSQYSDIGKGNQIESMCLESVSMSLCFGSIHSQLSSFIYHSIIQKEALGCGIDLETMELGQMVELGIEESNTVLCSELISALSDSLPDDVKFKESFSSKHSCWGRLFIIDHASQSHDKTFSNNKNNNMAEDASNYHPQNGSQLSE